jgi:hypothetical protein
MAEENYKPVSRRPIAFVKLPPSPTEKDVEEAAQAMLSAVQKVVKEEDEKKKAAAEKPAEKPAKPPPADSTKTTGTL